MNQKSTPEIKCPFLAIAKPNTSHLWRFVRDCNAYGMSSMMAFVVASQITMNQKGKGVWALLRGEAPDLYRLEEVSGVSHLDLYSAYLTQVVEQINAMSVAGEISLQNLVTIKEWIAAEERVPIIEASKIETILAFLYGGGDLETGMVNAENVISILSGRRPKAHANLNPTKLNQARRLAKWTA